MVITADFSEILFKREHLTLWDRNTKGGRPAPSVGDVREQVKDEMHLVVVIVT